MRAGLYILLFFIAGRLQAQTATYDTIIDLSEVVVSAGRIRQYGAGLRIQSLDMQAFRKLPGIKLSDALTGHSSHFVKTYGSNGLATISIRGTAPQHTTVYWNGFNINPSNIAMADFSMLPLFLFNHVEIVPGGSSTLTGSGAIGGSIHLNSQSGGTHNHHQVVAAFGQYNDRLMALKTGVIKEKLHFSTSIWVNSSDNDFAFVNTSKSGKPRERLTNADASQVGFLQEALLHFGSKQLLKAGFWLQEREAGIPPSMTMLRSHARQHDRMLRGYAQWNLKYRRVEYSAKTGYHHDYLKYTDTLTNIDSEIRVGVWNSEVILNSAVFKRIQFNAGAGYHIHHAETRNYQAGINPHRFSVFLLATRFIPELQWVFSVGARKESASDFRGIPPAFLLGWKGKMLNNLNGRMNFSTNYRIPTLNDRYWQPGGNPDLKAETSINLETGADFNYQQKNLKALFSVTLYTNRIKNWITWLPENSLFWAPENIGSVMIAGIESNLKFEHHASLFLHSLEISWVASKSLYGGTSLRDISKKSQLMYTPVHNMAVVYIIAAGQWYLQIVQKITGSRYTDRANTSKLPAFYTGNLSIARSFSMKWFTLSMNASVNNLTDQNYQVIQYRPMPGRTFHLSLVLDLLFRQKPTNNFNEHDTTP